MKFSVLLLSSCWLALGLPAWADQNSSTTAIPIEQQALEVVDHLVGIMTTAEQAVANSKAPDVRMTTCKVRVQGAEAALAGETTFLYQEQALSTKLSEPYRQRFLRIAPSRDRQSVQSLSFRPANAETWKGLCSQPEVQRTVSRKELGMPVCSVFLKRSGAEYVGRTPIDGCPANVRGAVRITNRIVLHDAGMDTWDRGFDAEGNQVWGAATDSYQFRRMPLSANP